MEDKSRKVSDYFFAVQSGNYKLNACKSKTVGISLFSVKYLIVMFAPEITQSLNSWVINQELIIVRSIMQLPFGTPVLPDV